MRALAFALFSLALAHAPVACGGKIDDGTDSGLDSGGPDSKSDTSQPVCKANGSICSSSVECCMPSVCSVGVCTSSPPPPPPCEPNGAQCTSSSQCCNQYCQPNGVCGSAPPPPPPSCKPDGLSCSVPTECCSNACVAGICGANVSCGTTSTKKCDQCIAQSCCGPFLNCGSDTTCSTWLACVQNCEQQGFSGFACTQNKCGLPSTTLEQQLYSCGQASCAQPCTVD